jgi:hypothetical protein
LGLVKSVIPRADQQSVEGRQRGIGVVLSTHSEETFKTETDNKRLTLRLEKRRGRLDGGEPQVRYRFQTVQEEDLPIDA